MYFKSIFANIQAPPTEKMESFGKIFRFFKGSSDKCVPYLMDIEDFQAEVRWVAEAVGSTFEGFDFVVHTFERTRRNRVRVPGKEAVQAGSERSAKCRKC